MPLLFLLYFFFVESRRIVRCLCDQLLHTSLRSGRSALELVFRLIFLLARRAVRACQQVNGTDNHWFATLPTLVSEPRVVGPRRVLPMKVGLSATAVTAWRVLSELQASMALVVLSPL
jgi:hypothetical protein